MCHNFFFMTSKMRHNELTQNHLSGCDCGKCRINILMGGTRAETSLKTNTTLTKQKSSEMYNKTDMSGGGKKPKIKVNTSKLTEAELKDHLYPSSPVSPFSEKMEDSPEMKYDDDMDELAEKLEKQHKNKGQTGGSLFKFTTGYEDFTGKTLAELKYFKHKMNYESLKKLG